MNKIILFIITVTSPLFSKGQPHPDTLIKKAKAEMRLQNLYQSISWGMYPTNAYEFDQTNQTVTYTIEGQDKVIVAVPEVLGTYYLADKTFLWADKNESINKKLSGKVSLVREKLPQKYQADKFQATIEFNEDILALFSYSIGANGFDMQNLGEAILYYALMDINVFKNGKAEREIRPSRHTEAIDGENLIRIVKKYHEEQFEIAKLVQQELMDVEHAFKRANEVHLKYWLNEDPYFSPSIGWPSDFDPQRTTDWVCFKTQENRIFVAYSINLEYGGQAHYAYELASDAKGEKRIVNEY
jgi:hypothetical protein